MMPQRVLLAAWAGHVAVNRFRSPASFGWRLLGPVQKAAQGRPAAGVHEDFALEQERARPQDSLAADRACGMGHDDTGTSRFGCGVRS
jgi:hypothetical protein